MIVVVFVFVNICINILSQKQTNCRFDGFFPTTWNFMARTSIKIEVSFSIIWLTFAVQHFKI